MSVGFFVFLIQAADAKVLNLALKKQNQNLEQGTLFLRDVLDSQNTDPAIIEHYGDLTIEVKPNQGAISPSIVLRVLSRAGMDLSKIHLVHLSSVPIKNFQKDKVKAQIKAKILEFLKKDSKQVWQFSLDQIKPDLPAKEDYHKLKLTPLTSLQNKNQITFRIDFLDANLRVIKKSEVLVSLKIKKEVLVAKHDLVEGQRVTKDDFKLSSLFIDPVGSYVFSTNEFNDKIWNLKKSLPKDKPLHKEQLAYISQLQKGAIVTLRSGDHRFHVTTLARVTEVRNDGLSVLVKNLQSQKEVVAVPINSTTVEVRF